MLLLVCVLLVFWRYDPNGFGDSHFFKKCTDHDLLKNTIVYLTVDLLDRYIVEINVTTRMFLTLSSYNIKTEKIRVPLS